MSIREDGISDAEASDEEIEDEINSDRKTIHDLEVSEICCSLVEVQQLLEQHRVTDAAVYIERGRNLIMRARCNTKKLTHQTTIDAFLMKWKLIVDN